MGCALTWRGLTDGGGGGGGLRLLLLALGVGSRAGQLGGRLGLTCAHVGRHRGELLQTLYLVLAVLYLD